MAKRTPEHNAKIGAALRARGVGQSSTKHCPKCDKDLPRSEFGVRSNGYARSYCLLCERAYNAAKSRKYWDAHPEMRPKQRESNRKAQFKRKYGITLEDYDNMLAEQDSKCAICRSPDIGDASRQFLYVDHCHDSQKIRGLLCSPCNLGLGAFKDNIEFLESAIGYLKKSTTDFT